MQTKHEMMAIFRWLSAGRFMVGYLILVLAFSQCFAHIDKKYIKHDCICDSSRNYPIDVNLIKTGHFFDASYVRRAVRDCYNVPGYFHTFFPLDLVFPIAYSLLMFSMLNLSKPARGRILLANSIRAGAAFDYCEDLSFARYLCTHVDGYAVATGIFTTVKTCLLLLNMLACLYLLWRWTWKGPAIPLPQP